MLFIDAIICYGDDYMTTDAQRRAIKKYNTEKLDRVLLRLPKGMKARIEKHIKPRNETMNGFIKRAIDETIERDQLK